MIDRAIGGVPARELAELYGTPLFVIDLDVLDLEIDRLSRAFADRGITVAYAGKAFLCVALAEALAATPLRLDVCSLGELLTAERGGMPAGRLYFHGVAKTDAELDAISEGRVAFDVIDNRDELERLAQRVAPGAPVDVMLRINTGIEAHTHEFVRTGGENTKFGFAPAELPSIFARLRTMPQLRVIGLHSHVGSQIADAAPLVANVGELVAHADAARAAGCSVTDLIAGGGFAVAERPDDEPPVDVDALGRALAAAIAGTPYRLAVEPGRAIVARAGSSLYRVMTVKTQGSRRFVVVDGGMADNPRPLLYGSYHEPRVMRSAAVGPSEPATVAGRSCENDVIVDSVLPHDLAAGDLIAMQTTGAYTWSMASNYNRFSKPPVVFVRDGTHRCVVRGESPADVLRNDV